MSVSRRLAALEEELGVRLFHRTTRAVALTADGETFLPLAQAMLDARNAALAAFSDCRDGLGGVLKVTAPNRIGRALVVPLVVKLMAANPHLQIDLTLTDGIVDIVAAGIDVAVRVAPLQMSELIATKLADNPRILCASPAYIKARGRPKKLSDIDAHSCLTLHAMDGWTFRTGERVVTKRISGRLAANSVDAVRAACLAGAGIAMLTYWDVAEDLADKTLMSIALSDAEPEALAIWAILPTRLYMPPRARAFIDAMKAALVASGP